MSKLLRSRNFWLAVGALVVPAYAGMSATALGFVFPEAVVSAWDLFINALPGG